jgi:hypothetical protein
MSKADQKSRPKKAELTEEQIEQLLKKGWAALQKAFDDIIDGCEMQKLDLVVDALKLTKKIAIIYEKAHMASFYATKGLASKEKVDKDAE